MAQMTLLALGMPVYVPASSSKLDPYYSYIAN
jgi:hypothetical protein